MVFLLALVITDLAKRDSQWTSSFGLLVVRNTVCFWTIFPYRLVDFAVYFLTELYMELLFV